jgi:transcriptional regulator PpsR
LLLQTSLDAIFILDGTTHAVVEANPQARALIAEGTRRRSAGLKDIFAPDSVPAVQALLATVRATGRGDDVRANLIEENRDVLVVASQFREDPASFFLVRIAATQGDPNNVSIPKLKSKLLKLVESAPDGFVVTDLEGRVMTANAAFLDMAQLPTEELVRSEPLSRWVGRPGVEVDVLVANLLQRGSVRLFATTLQGEHGVVADVEICAASVMNGGRQCFGFAIRNVGRRLQPEPREGAVLPRSIQQLTELIGRVALKDLVRESTDVIERLCIETALEMTGDNRASAAEMLGLSRQSLYVKLRRYGLGDLASEGA